MSLSRTGCCDTWPKPCPYHEGVADALDAVGAHTRLCVCGHLESEHVPMRTDDGYFVRCWSCRHDPGTGARADCLAGRCHHPEGPARPPREELVRR